MCIDSFAKNILFGILLVAVDKIRIDNFSIFDRKDMIELDMGCNHIHSIFDLKDIDKVGKGHNHMRYFPILIRKDIDKVGKDDMCRMKGLQLILLDS